MIDQEPSGTPEASPKRDLSTRLSVAVGLVLLALLSYGFLSARGSGRPQRGELAPDFTLVLFDGSQVSLADLRGQIVVLNFWASWCSPCRREAPALQETWARYEDEGVAFVGVTYQDAKGASQKFIQEFRITYANGTDEKGRISRAYGVIGVPETFIIDRDGKVAWFQIGEVQAEVLARQLELAAE
jgi:cytochrome c biogenesis protein CcmG/thiol:disulfide interchange protein DsbE